MAKKQTGTRVRDLPPEQQLELKRAQAQKLAAEVKRAEAQQQIAAAKENMDRIKKG